MGNKQETNMQTENETVRKPLEWPENIVPDRHEVTGKWVIHYATDEQAELMSAALHPKAMPASYERVDYAIALVRLIAEYPHKNLHEHGLVSKAKEAHAILARAFPMQGAMTAGDAVGSMELLNTVADTLGIVLPGNGAKLQEAAALIQSCIDQHTAGLREENEQLREREISRDAECGRLEERVDELAKALQRSEAILRHMNTVNGAIPHYDKVTMNEIRCETTKALAAWKGRG